jgi:quercetin dioxygenase-like cupin family protein
MREAEKVDNYQNFIKTSPLKEGPITLNCRPSPSFSDYHQAPRRQYVVNLSGLAEFETADGSKRRLSPGDVLVAEDLTGHGHIARSIGEAFRVSLAIPLTEGEGCDRP